MSFKQQIWSLASMVTYLPMSYGKQNLIMNYHSVGEGDTDLYGNISIEHFRDHLKFFSNFSVVDLPDVLTESEEKQISLTFDDGFHNFYKNVLPLLREFDMPATVFINPSFIGDRNYQQLISRHGTSNPPEKIMMDHKQTRELVDSDLVTIGNHTMDHIDLSTVEDKEVLHEQIVDSKEQIEEEFNTTIERFSYPYGQKNQVALDIVSKSHKYAVGEYRKLVDHRDSRYDLPRIAGDQSLRDIRWLTSDLSHRIRRGYRSFEIPELS